MRVALDTNVLVYAEGVGGAAEAGMAATVIDALSPVETVVPAQVLGELFRVLTGKARWPSVRARDAAAEWAALFVVEPTTKATLGAAIELAAEHHLFIFDAIILAVAADAGCKLLLSQDMGEGFTWRGVTVVDPFTSSRHPLLAAALATRGGTDATR